MGSNKRKRRSRTRNNLDVPIKDLVKHTGEGHFEVNILGVLHTLKFDKTNPKEHGWCDHDKLVINKNSRGRRRLDTIIHETLHKLDWHKDEEWVRAAARVLSTLLWELGYRGNPKEAIKLIEYM